MQDDLCNEMSKFKRTCKKFISLHKALRNLITKIESLNLIMTCENDAQTGICNQNSARKSTIINFKPQESSHGGLVCLFVSFSHSVERPFEYTVDQISLEAAA